MGNENMRESKALSHLEPSIYNKNGNYRESPTNDSDKQSMSSTRSDRYNMTSSAQQNQHHMQQIPVEKISNPVRVRANENTFE